MSPRTALSAILVLAAVACTNANGPVVSGVRPQNDGLFITVENDAPVNLRVYALEAGGETMLGRVGAVSEAVLKVRSPNAGPLRLVAKPSTDIGGRRHVSEPIQIVPGQHITWQLRYSPGVSDVPHLSTFRVVACAGGPGCN